MNENRNGGQMNTKKERPTKTLVSHCVTQKVIDELRRRGFTVVVGDVAECSRTDFGPHYWVKANVHGNRLRTIEKEIRAYV